MRRMKPLPTETYPITKYEDAAPGIELIIEGDILNNLRKSPHAITLHLYSQLAGCGDHAGVVDIKMMPGQVILEGDDKYSYLGITSTDNGEILIVNGFVQRNPNYPALYLDLSMLQSPAPYSDIFKAILNNFIEKGYGLGDIAKISIEPVADSNVIKSLIV